MMKWHVFATAGLPFPNPGALLILRLLIRALGVPKDGLFSHFIKLHAFLTVVTNMILVHKNFGVVLMTLDCVLSTTWKEEIRLSDSLRTVNDWAFFMFQVKLCFHLLKDKFSWECSISTYAKSGLHVRVFEVAGDDLFLNGSLLISYLSVTP